MSFDNNTVRLNTILAKYPALTLLGTIPSPNIKAKALEWSTIANNFSRGSIVEVKSDSDRFNPCKLSLSSTICLNFVKSDP